jgi:hypothetical protein
MSKMTKWPNDQMIKMQGFHPPPPLEAPVVSAELAAPDVSFPCPSLCKVTKQRAAHRDPCFIAHHRDLQARLSKPKKQRCSAQRGAVVLVRTSYPRVLPLPNNLHPLRIIYGHKQCHPFNLQLLQKPIFESSRGCRTLC